MGALDLSGSLSLDLLVSEFFHPTFHKLYMVSGWTGGRSFRSNFDFFKRCLGVV